MVLNLCCMIMTSKSVFLTPACFKQLFSIFSDLRPISSSDSQFLPLRALSTYWRSTSETASGKRELPCKWGFCVCGKGWGERTGSSEDAVAALGVTQRRTQSTTRALDAMRATEAEIAKCLSCPCFKISLMIFPCLGTRQPDRCVSFSFHPDALS